jgi:hypothetical protein
MPSKTTPRADAVAFNLAELRRYRQLTQVELAERLERVLTTGERQLDELSSGF